jgi:hypothetical protein
MSEVEDANPATGQDRRDMATVALLLVGGVVIVGWVVGVIRLWESARWSVRDKLLGTLVWPLGLAFPFALALTPLGKTCVRDQVENGPTRETCTGALVALPGWLSAVLLGLFLLAPVLVALWLLRARRLVSQ